MGFASIKQFDNMNIFKLFYNIEISLNNYVNINKYNISTLKQNFLLFPKYLQI